MWSPLISNLSNQLNSRFSSYRFIMVGNFRHRLARSICYIHKSHQIRQQLGNWFHPGLRDFFWLHFPGAELPGWLVSTFSVFFELDRATFHDLRQNRVSVWRATTVATHDKGVEMASWMSQVISRWRLPRGRKGGKVRWEQISCRRYVAWKRRVVWIYNL